ncbi:hypothetical protein AB0L71_28440 [Streptomyces sp. NPDC052052]|uniref:hypothetical protein n=1 Tax=Streptomyces sp. NPDC052052 TaxID=3154756 RepID=UPI00342531B3
MGQADDTTAQRLRLLQREFVQPGSRGPGDGRTATQVHAPAPLNIGIVDRIRAAVYEVETHTRASAPEAGRFTGEAERVYDWARQHTAHLEPERQAVREALIYRQGLEHAIAAGDTDVVTRHPCPGCGCWGMYWDRNEGEAFCVNRYCVDDAGLSRTWSLAHIAQQHVARLKSLKSQAT